ncbi:DNA-methyltransferase [Candidatus Stoquefichus sp. SB1]|uniref:DNA-methyltransferase n=1 Tax=Candidatus Stoquefichus sp. SB1 TaxID=1658109 RepID=UPI00067EC293|nr:site-specific DNA-methyltransferase [Candidatus Stoquefichus sp. SB1]
MNYKTYNDDCVNVCGQLPSDSIDLTITSVPFANLYTYSDDERDFSNVKDLDEFFKQMDFLITELYRITRPGRLICLHCKQIPTFKGRDGAMGLVDFRGMLIRAFQKHKWIYHGEITVWTDPQIEATRTKSASILWNSYKKFAENTRTGMADYVVVMQKCEREDEWIHVIHENNDDQFHEWTRIASPCWAIGRDITPRIQRTNVLNSKLAKEDKDEKHMTPLQLDLIEHLMKWYSNEGEVVLDPFAGIMSVPYVAMKNNRKAIGIELKTSYFNLGNKYLKELELQLKQPTLFEVEDSV